MKSMHTKKDKTLIVGIASLLVGIGGGFLGGMKYESGKTIPLASIPGSNGLPRNPNTPQNGGPPTDATGGRSGALMGQIAAKDNGTLTIKMPDGSSKTVTYTGASTVTKTENVSVSDLVSGQQIRANGKVASDGSIAAQAIQIIPEDQALPSASKK